jgi:hypothetical protein
VPSNICKVWEEAFAGDEGSVIKGSSWEQPARKDWFHNQYNNHHIVASKNRVSNHHTHTIISKTRLAET